MSLLFEYRFILLVILVIILYAVFEWQKFKATCYNLMLQAKDLAKDAILKSGDQQMEWVIKKAYQFMPKALTVFITEQRMRILVQYLYDKAKDLLDDGKLNGSI